MTTRSSALFHKYSRWLVSLCCFIFTISFAGPAAFAAAPTAEDDAKIVGTWHVKGPGFERRYEITAGRNIKIEGAGFETKRGRLMPQPTGGYIVKLEKQTLRILLVPAADQLEVEGFAGKNLELGLPSMWKTTAARIPR
jgi:hypothetical protein